MEFFLEQDARAKSLAKDTTYMGQDLRTRDSIILEQNQVRKDLQDKFTTQEAITANYKDSYSKLEVKYAKLEKRLRIFKNTTLIFVSTTIMLGSIIVLIK